MKKKKEIGIIVTMAKEDELVLAIPAKVIPQNPRTELQTEGLEKIPGIIKKHGIFKRRGDVEEDRAWKQVIPYLVFKYKKKYFIMHRNDKGDYRLVNMHSLGIGGHINKEDLGSNNIIDWAKREFTEEVSYTGTFTSKPLGIINNNTVPIDQVHLAYVILLEGDSNKISTNKEDKLKTGELLTLKEIEAIYPKLESWSKIVFECLNKAA